MPWSFPFLHSDWRSSIFTSIMKMRRRENSRKFSSFLHLLSKMRRREIYSFGGGGSVSKWGEGRNQGNFSLLPIYPWKWGEGRIQGNFPLLSIYLAKWGEEEFIPWGGGLLAIEEKGEIKEIFSFSPFNHENEEKGESKGNFPVSQFTIKNGDKRNLFLGGGLLADEEKGESKEFFLFSPFTYQDEEK